MGNAALSQSAVATHPAFCEGPCWLWEEVPTKKAEGQAPDRLSEEGLLNTNPETGLTELEVRDRQARFGLNKIEEKKQSLLVKFFLEFVQPMPMVIWVAIIIECVSVGMEWPRPAACTGLVDIACLLVLQILNVVVGFVEEVKAMKEIEALKACLDPMCTVKRSGKTHPRASSELVPGDIVTLRAGAAVPADCRLYPGEMKDTKNTKPIYVDCSALTGESLPVKKGRGDQVLLSTTVVRGEADAIVVATGARTECGQTQQLMDAVDEPSNFDKVLQKMLIILISTGLLVNLVIIIYMVQIQVDTMEMLGFNIVLLIASIPIALRVVCVSTLAFGCRELAAEGAIVSRLNAIEELAGMTILCSDKTGTLTLNKMELQPSATIHRNGQLQDCKLESSEGQQLLFYAAMATKWWEPPPDAIDTLVLNAMKHKVPELNSYFLTNEGKHEDFLPFDPQIKKTAATVRDTRTGKLISICKGAPNVLLNMCADKAAIELDYNRVVTDLASRGIRALTILTTEEDVNLSPNDEGVLDLGSSWKLAGILTFLDPCRPDTKATIEMVYSMGVGVKMITGDNHLIAAETSRTLGLVSHPENSLTPVIYKHDEMPEVDMAELQSAPDLGDRYGATMEIADGFAGVFPSQKYFIVQALRQYGHVVGMTGDGVNDAPALKRADVGIAVMGATDAARGASDIVLTKPGLSTIATAMIASRRVFARMQNFIIYRIACTAQLLFFFMISCLFYCPGDYNSDWPCYFTTPVISLVTVTILNDGTIISVAFDNVNVGRKPQKWNLAAMFAVSASIGGVALISSLVLLVMGLNAQNDESWMRQMNIPALSYGQLMAMMYLKVSLSDYLSLFNARTRSWLWSRKPSGIVVGAGLFATVVATALSIYWPFGSQMEGIPPLLALYIWGYTLIAALFQDMAKVFTYWVLAKLHYIDPVDEVDADAIVATLKAATGGTEDDNEAKSVGKADALHASERGRLIGSRETPESIL